MLILILKSLWFILPAGLANSGASLGRFIPFLAQPVDFNKTLGGKPIFGVNKTYKGLVLGIITGTFVFLLQKEFYGYQFFKDISLFDYSKTSPWIGLALASGAILGDLMASFFKRRFNKNPGQTWFPWDQIDWVIGAFILTIPFIQIPINVILTTFILGLILHILTKIIGYWMGLEKSWI